MAVCVMNNLLLFPEAKASRDAFVELLQNKFPTSAVRVKRRGCGGRRRREESYFINLKRGEEGEVRPSLDGDESDASRVV